MPCPQKLLLATGFVHLRATSKIYIQGMSTERQKNALRRTNLQLSRFDNVNSTHLVLVNNRAAADIEIIVQKQGNKGSNYVLPQLNDDESYQLIISAKKALNNPNEETENINGKATNAKSQAHVRINANSDFGALHGLTTLVQIITTTVNKGLLPQLTIDDKPRFSWRGLLIDSVRHFIPLKALKRQLDGMAAAKLNVFHWHLTDDQGWRFESKRYPKLHKLASDNRFYSQDEIKDLVRYASLLGIRVVPEFDVPGHASAIAVAYPELITEDKKYQMERHWGVFEPLLDVSNVKVYQFINEIIEELTELFPDRYLHIGGDEVHPMQWQQSENIQQLMQTHGLVDNHDLQRHFNSRVQKILAKHQRKMMGWDEVFHKDLPKDIMVQSWQGLESLNVIAANGFQGLLSTGYYIDQPQYSHFHYLNDPLGQPLSTATLPKSSQRIVPANDEYWQTWALTVPRLKGSAIEGSLTLISNKGGENTALTGYLKLNGNHHKKITVNSRLTMNDTVNKPLLFSVDSWMGPLHFELALTDPNNAESTNSEDKVMIGNSYYPLISQSIIEQPESIELLPLLTLKQSRNILGGEATLWTEMVDETNIDLRTWPRLFVIAERFWSPKELVDVSSMYQRLMVIDDYAANIIALAHQQQQQKGFSMLLKPAIKQSKDMDSALKALFIIAQAFEPAHYYTRHHLKYQQNNYHQQAALNNFVDYLPVESFSLLNMRKQLEAYIAGDDSALLLVNSRLISWQNSAKHLSLFLQGQHKQQAENDKLANLRSLLNELNDFTVLALNITELCTAAKPLSIIQYQQIKQRLSHAEIKQQEHVMAAQPLFKQLLSHCHSSY